mgnify:CR=1 FL=1
MEGIESMAKELIARYSHISEDKQKLFAPQKRVCGCLSPLRPASL